MYSFPAVMLMKRDDGLVDPFCIVSTSYMQTIKPKFFAFLSNSGIQKLLALHIQILSCL